MYSDNTYQCQDIYDPEIVEVQLADAPNHRGFVTLWVSVNNICRLRVRVRSEQLHTVGLGDTGHQVE